MSLLYFQRVLVKIWTRKILEFDVPEEKEPIFLQFQTTEADV